MCNECSTGEARLTQTVDSGDFAEGRNLTRAGRVEICINNAWGTICNSSFDEIEAQTACSNIEGFTYQGNYSNSYYAKFECRQLCITGSNVKTNDFFTKSRGPIFLSDLKCDGSEASLLKCQNKYRLPPGLVRECDHSQDAAVICQGKSYSLAVLSLCKNKAFMS